MSLNREIQWNRGYPSGDKDVTGSVRELLLEILTYQPRLRLPPYEVLADIVDRGGVIGGMGGALDWAGSGLQLSRSMYDDLEKLVPPDSQATGCGSVRYEEWIAWCFERDSGLDYATHLALLDSLRAADLARSNSPGTEAETIFSDALTAYLNFVNSIHCHTTSTS